MKIWKQLSTSTALAVVFCATGAQADVTAAQVWQEWKDYYTSVGQTVSAASEEMQGDTLLVKDVKMASKFADGSSEGTIAELRLQEVGDGSVDITMSKEIPFTIHSQTPDGKPADMTIVITQTDMKAKVSGTPEAMTYAFTAPTVAFAMDTKATTAEMPPIKFLATLNDLAGETHSAIGDARAITWDMTSASMDMAVSAADPESGDTFNLTGKINGLTSKGDANMPKGIDMQNLGAALQAGMATNAQISYVDGAYKIDVTDATGTATADTSAVAGSLNVKLSKDGLAYGGDTGETKMSMTGPTLPFPVDASIAQTAFNFQMPVAKSETASPASLLIKMVDLKVSDALWNMFDPATQLPRDPATLIVDISGTVRPLIDLFDPAQAVAAAEGTGQAEGQPAPFEVSSAKINALQFKAVGADLTGTGDFTFDNTESTPKPNGFIDLKLVGANKLMDTLVAMKLVPEDQMIGMRMMIGAFAVPAGEDTLTSKIEFTPDGGILANGQKIQ